ncbi:MAG: AraC family transcriptional regulator [Lentisphaeria bacterium]
MILETGDGVRTLVPHRIYLLPPERPFEATYRRGTKITAFHVYIGDRFGFPLGRDLDGIPEIRDRRIFDAVIAAVESGEEPVWQAAAFQTVTIFCRPLFPKLEQRARMSPVLKKVVDIIAAMPPGKLRVATIAEEMHTSRAALSKSFERQFKIPLKRYIRDTAVHAAKKFLLNADMTVAEVACRLGYKEPSYFQRVFKQCVGMTPFTYRRKHRFPAS